MPLYISPTALTKAYEIVKIFDILFEIGQESLHTRHMREAVQFTGSSSKPLNFTHSSKVLSLLPHSSESSSLCY